MLNKKTKKRDVPPSGQQPKSLQQNSRSVARQLNFNDSQEKKRKEKAKKEREAQILRQKLANHIQNTSQASQKILLRVGQTINEKKCMEWVLDNSESISYDEFWWFLKTMSANELQQQMHYLIGAIPFKDADSFIENLNCIGFILHIKNTLPKSFPEQVLTSIGKALYARLNLAENRNFFSNKNLDKFLKVDHKAKKVILDKQTNNLGKLPYNGQGFGRTLTRRGHNNYPSYIWSTTYYFCTGANYLSRMYIALDQATFFLMQCLDGEPQIISEKYLAVYQKEPYVFDKELYRPNKNINKVLRYLILTCKEMLDCYACEREQTKHNQEAVWIMCAVLQKAVVCAQLYTDNPIDESSHELLQQLVEYMQEISKFVGNIAQERNNFKGKRLFNKRWDCLKALYKKQKLDFNQECVKCDCYYELLFDLFQINRINENEHVTTSRYLRRYLNILCPKDQASLDKIIKEAQYEQEQIKLEMHGTPEKKRRKQCCQKIIEIAEEKKSELEKKGKETKENDKKNKNKRKSCQLYEMGDFSYDEIFNQAKQQQGHLAGYVDCFNNKKAKQYMWLCQTDKEFIGQFRLKPLVKYITQEILLYQTKLVLNTSYCDRKGALSLAYRFIKPCTYYQEVSRSSSQLIKQCEKFIQEHCSKVQLDNGSPKIFNPMRKQKLRDVFASLTLASPVLRRQNREIAQSLQFQGGSKNSINPRDTISPSRLKIYDFKYSNMPKSSNVIVQQKTEDFKRGDLTFDNFHKEINCHKNRSIVILHKILREQLSKPKSLGENIKHIICYASFLHPTGLQLHNEVHESITQYLSKQLIISNDAKIFISSNNNQELFEYACKKTSALLCENKIKQAILAWDYVYFFHPEQNDFIFRAEVAIKLANLYLNNSVNFNKGEFNLNNDNLYLCLHKLIDACNSLEKEKSIITDDAIKKAAKKIIQYSTMVMFVIVNISYLTDGIIKSMQILQKKVDGVSKQVCLRLRSIDNEEEDEGETDDENDIVDDCVDGTVKEAKAIFDLMCKVCCKNRRLVDMSSEEIFKIINHCNEFIQQLVYPNGLPKSCDDTNNEFVVLARSDVIHVNIISCHHDMHIPRYLYKLIHESILEVCVRTFKFQAKNLKELYSEPFKKIIRVFVGALTGYSQIDKLLEIQPRADKYISDMQLCFEQKINVFMKELTGEIDKKNHQRENLSWGEEKNSFNKVLVEMGEFISKQVKEEISEEHFGRHFSDMAQQIARWQREFECMVLSVPKRQREEFKSSDIVKAIGILKQIVQSPESLVENKTGSNKDFQEKIMHSKGLVLNSFKEYVRKRLCEDPVYILVTKLLLHCFIYCNVDSYTFKQKEFLLQPEKKITKRSKRRSKRTLVKQPAKKPFPMQKGGLLFAIGLEQSDFREFMKSECVPDQPNTGVINAYIKTVITNFLACAEFYEILSKEGKVFHVVDELSTLYGISSLLCLDDYFSGKVLSRDDNFCMGEVFVKCEFKLIQRARNSYSDYESLYAKVEKYLFYNKKEYSQLWEIFQRHLGMKMSSENPWSMMFLAKFLKIESNDNTRLTAYKKIDFICLRAFDVLSLKNNIKIQQELEKEQTRYPVIYKLVKEVYCSFWKELKDLFDSLGFKKISKHIDALIQYSPKEGDTKQQLYDLYFNIMEQSYSVLRPIEDGAKAAKVLLRMVCGICHFVENLSQPKKNKLKEFNPRFRIHVVNAKALYDSIKKNKKTGSRKELVPLSLGTLQYNIFGVCVSWMPNESKFLELFSMAVVQAIYLHNKSAKKDIRDYYELFWIPLRKMVVGGKVPGMLFYFTLFPDIMRHYFDFKTSSNSDKMVKIKNDDYKKLFQMLRGLIDRIVAPETNADLNKYLHFILHERNFMVVRGKLNSWYQQYNEIFNFACKQEDVLKTYLLLLVYQRIFKIICNHNFVNFSNVSVALCNLVSLFNKISEALKLFSFKKGDEFSLAHMIVLVRQSLQSLNNLEGAHFKIIFQECSILTKEPCYFEKHAPQRILSRANAWECLYIKDWTQNLNVRLQGGGWMGQPIRVFDLGKSFAQRIWKDCAIHPMIYLQRKLLLGNENNLSKIYQYQIQEYIEYCKHDDDYLLIRENDCFFKWFRQNQKSVFSLCEAVTGQIKEQFLQRPFIRSYQPKYFASVDDDNCINQHMLKRLIPVINSAINKLCKAELNHEQKITLFIYNFIGYRVSGEISAKTKLQEMYKQVLKDLYDEFNLDVSNEIHEACVKLGFCQSRGPEELIESEIGNFSQK